MGTDEDRGIDRVKAVPGLFHRSACGLVTLSPQRSVEADPMRPQVNVAATMDEAGGELLSRALDPAHWSLPTRRVTRDNLCQVGTVQVCASLDITPTLDTFIRVSFRGPDLSPMHAAELLEQFVSKRFTYVPNAEWFVEIDARKWIHFSRKYTEQRLEA